MSPSQPTSFVAEADGYTLTVTVDRVQLAPGETINFKSTFHNGTNQPIDYAGPECAGGANGWVHVALPVKPVGKIWSGIRQIFKSYVLTEGNGPGGVPALDPLSVNMSGPECGEWTMSSNLDPGKSLTRSMSWKAVIVRGVDPLEGTVPFDVAVSYDQLTGPPSYPPDYSGPYAAWSPNFKQLAIHGEVRIVGQGRALKGPGEILDGALADQKFAAWLAERPATTWSNANLFLTSAPKPMGIMPKGPAWELELFRERGVPRNWAIAFIDPFDASLISVTYCNIPCDR